MSNDRSMIHDMTQGNIFGPLVRFAIPLMLANLLQTVYSLVDALVVGNFLGTVELAAVSTAGDLITFYTMICVGFASAGQVIIGQYVGRRDPQSIEQAIGTMLTFLTLLAVGCMVLCFGLTDLHLKLSNVPAESLPAAKTYFLTCSAGMVFIYGYNMVGSALRGMGDSSRPLLFVAIASVVNLVLDLVFILVFDMGVFGAAFATVLGQGVSFLSALIYLYHKREAFGFSFSPSSFIPHRGQLQLLLQQGIPQAVQFAAVVISVLFVGAHINAYGVAAGAANGIAAKLENILRIGAGSMSTAGCTMVAQNTGAGKPERVKKSVYCVLGISTIYALAISAVLIFCPKQVFALFDSDPEVLACAQIYVWPGVVTYLAYASRAAFTSVYNGVGNARLSLFSGLMDGVAARIGLSFLLGSVLNLGLVGYWYGYGLAGHVSALIGLIYFASGRWKSYKMLS